MPALISPQPPSPDLAYLGIDPGVGGGIALVVGDDIAGLWKMDEDPVQMWAIFKAVRESFPGVRAAIEKVSGWIGGRPGNTAAGGEGYKHSGQPASAIGKFMKNAGMMEGFLIAAEIPYVAPVPQTWQRAMGIQMGKMSYTEKKRVLKEKAQGLFPNEPVTLKTCDALLLAVYARVRLIQEEDQGRI